MVEQIAGIVLDDLAAAACAAVNDDRRHEIGSGRVILAESKNGEAEQITGEPADGFEIAFGGFETEVVIDADGRGGGEAEFGMVDALQENYGGCFGRFDEYEAGIGLKGGEPLLEFDDGVLAVLHCSEARGMEKCHEASLERKWVGVEMSLTLF
jgi:hypothetical protein